jgi:hypothetical protein
MYNMSTRSSGSLTPTYGLGTSNRTVGAILLGSPRTKLGSANRIYSYLARTQGASYALYYMRDISGLGPFRIQGTRLVWN